MKNSRRFLDTIKYKTILLNVIDVIKYRFCTKQYRDNAVVKRFCFYRRFIYRDIRNIRKSQSQIESRSQSR